MAPAPTPSTVRLVEVGPRDGLQNEARTLSVGERVAFIDRLAAAGHTTIEVGAFVSPRHVPQMADTAAVFAGLTRRPGVTYTALVPNGPGLTRALHAGADEIAIFAAASETFSQRNIGQGIDASLRTYADVTAEAFRAGLRVRGYLSTCFGCPFEGPVAPERVAALTAALLDMGVYEVALSDTIGVAHPRQVTELLEVVGRQAGISRLALHMHDTRGTALVNVYAGLEAGIGGRTRRVPVRTRCERQPRH